jgi:hypothetical protein
MTTHDDNNRGDSRRRWFGWYSIPVSIALAWTGAILRHSSASLGAIDDIAGWGGLIAGMACIVWSRPQTQGLKWILCVLYPFVMFPIVGLIDIMVNGLHWIC